MSTRKTMAGVRLGLCLLLALPLLTVFFAGCTKEEPAAHLPTVPQAEAKEKPVVPPAAPTPKPLRVEPAPAGAPAVVPLLKLTPPSASISIAAPSADGMLNKAITLAKRLAPPATIDQFVAMTLTQAAVGLGEPPVASFAELAQGLGVDPDFPAAIYVNPDNSMGCVLDQIKAEQQKTPPAAAAEPETPPAPPVPPFHNMDAIDPPHFACVVGLLDAAKAEAALKDILTKNGVDVTQETTVKHGEATIHQYTDQFMYVIAGNVMLFGNYPDMLREVLDRFQTPAEVRYGGPDIPAGAPDELVALTYPDKFFPLIREFVASQEAQNPMMKMQADMLAEYEAALTSADPLTTVMTWTDTMIEFTNHVDWQTHPGLAKVEGEASAFRLAPLVPEGTMLLISQRFNDINREMIKKSWFANIPPEMIKESGQEQVFATLKQALDLLNDELVVAVAGEQMLPQVLIMAGVQDIAKGKDAFKSVTTLTPVETYQDAEICQFVVQFVPPVYVAFAGNWVAVSNDLAGIKSVLDLNKSNGRTNFFAKLDPPIDPASPHYGMFLLKSQLLTKVVQPYLMMFGAPKEATDGLARVTGTISEIRAVRAKQGNWGRYCLRISMTPPAPPAPPGTN